MTVKDQAEDKESAEEGTEPVEAEDEEDGDEVESEDEAADLSAGVKEHSMPKPGINHRMTPLPAQTKKEISLTISRRRFGGLLFLAVLLAFGVAAWRLAWYQTLLDRYNQAAITVKVKEGDKYAIEGATVEVNGHAYTTDSSGKVTLSPITAGHYRLILSKEGYDRVESELTVKRGENDPVIIPLSKAAEKLYTLKGKVTDYVSGQPLADAQLAINSKTVVTDAAGEYSLGLLATGDYKVSASKNGYADKEQMVALTTADLVADDLRLVPDNQVIFVSNRDSKRGLYAADYDGGNQRLLVGGAGQGENFDPLLSPDNSWVLFSSTRDGLKDNYGSDLARLYLIDSRGENLRQISPNLSPEFSPVWSADSRRVYFYGYTSTKMDQGTHAIYDVSKQQLLEVGEEAMGLVFSPDGTMVAYHVTGTEEVAASSAANVAGVASGSDPLVSPTPTSIALAEVPATKMTVDSLKVFNLVNGERTILVKRAQYLSELRFSSDGLSVGYDAVVDGARKRFEAPVAGGNEQEVAVLPFERRAYTKAPRGSQKAYIGLQAFIEERDGKKDLYIVDSGEANEKRLTTLGTVNDKVAPHWDPTGRYLTFAVRRDGESALYVVAADGSAEANKIVDYYESGS